MKKIPLLLGLALAFGGSAPAQTLVPPASSAAVAAATAPTPAASTLFTAEQLDQLLGPIALYPDALIALILPASTVSSDVVLAARYLQGGGNPADVDNQPWDDSVRALGHYPDVVKWLDENLAWTKQLGEVFAAQPAEVMNAVQRLRAQARAAGTLVDTPQQQVVVADNAITIVPAQPDVIYVPYYDPDIVYVGRPGYYASSYFSFSAPFASGFWLSYNLDWAFRRVWVVNRADRERYWRDHRHDWTRRPRPDWTPRRDPPPHYVWAPRPGFSHPPRASAPVRAQPAVMYRPRVPDEHRYARPDSRPDRRPDSRPDSRPGPAENNRRDFTGPRAPGSATPAPSSAAAAPLPQLQLANPLPQPLPSPLPNRPAPAAPRPENRRGSDDNRGERARSYRSAPAPSVSAPAPAASAPRALPPPTPIAPMRVANPPAATPRPAPAPQAAPSSAPATEPAAESKKDRHSDRRGRDQQER